MRGLLPSLVLSSMTLANSGAAPARAGFEGPSRADARGVGDPVSPLAVPTIKAELDSILDAAADTTSFNASVARAQGVFDRLVAYGDVKADAGAFRLAAQWLRVLKHLESVPAADRGAALKTLRAHDRLAAALARVVESGSDRDAKVYQLVVRLGQERDSSLDRFAELAAAVAVVHDAPLSFERAKAADAMDIFDYFVSIDARATLAPSKLPAELLVFVVDTPAQPDELRWALATFPGDRKPGRHFFDVDYDTDNFKHNKKLKLDAYDFTLQSIRKVGGVCRHQAYFAAQVAKALGVPSVIDTARGSGTGHAWAGYLDTSVSPARWDFDDGRYKEYQGLKGNVTDPQSRRSIPDSQVALTAQFAAEPADNRMLSAALTDAAARLGEVGGESVAPVKRGVGAVLKKPTPAPSYPPPIEWGEFKPRPPRASDRAARLALLEDAVRASPATRDAWQTVADMASRQQLNHDQIVHWSEAVVQFCGTAYPDFALDVLKPMFESVDDPAEQDRLWQWAYDKFFKGVSDARRRRVDLAAMVRFEQAEQWEQHGQPGKAWERYKQVITEFPNDGPFVVSAVQQCAAILKKNGKPASDQLAMYQDAWRRIKKPGEMSREFASQSNWYRVGSAYEKALREAGKASDADAVKATLHGGK